MGSQVTPGKGQKFSEHGLPGAINQFAQWIGAIPDQSRGAPQPAPAAKPAERDKPTKFKRALRQRGQPVRNPGMESPIRVNESFF